MRHHSLDRVMGFAGIRGAKHGGYATPAKNHGLRIQSEVPRLINRRLHCRPKFRKHMATQRDKRKKKDAEAAENRANDIFGTKVNESATNRRLIRFTLRSHNI
jgi:hypothetical protein